MFRPDIARETGRPGRLPRPCFAFGEEGAAERFNAKGAGTSFNGGSHKIELESPVGGYHS